MRSARVPHQVSMFTSGVMRLPLDKSAARVQLWVMIEPPSHTLYEVLKDFQPALAAVIAFAAACIAYAGATSKTRFDKKAIQHDRERETLGLYLRLRYDVVLIRTLMAGIARDAKVNERLATGTFASEERDGLRSAKQIIDAVPEITAAWNKMQLFPINVGEKLDLLRRRMMAVSLAIDPVIYPKFPDPETVYPHLTLTDLCKNASHDAEILLDEINPIISSTTKYLESLE